MLVVVVCCRVLFVTATRLPGLVKTTVGRLGLLSHSSSSSSSLSAPSVLHRRMGRRTGRKLVAQTRDAAGGRGREEFAIVEDLVWRHSWWVGREVVSVDDHVIVVTLVLT